MKIDFTEHEVELLDFACARALSALHHDMVNYTLTTKVSAELCAGLVQLTNDLIELRAKIVELP